MAGERREAEPGEVEKEVKRESSREEGRKSTKGLVEKDEKPEKPESNISKK